MTTPYASRHGRRYRVRFCLAPRHPNPAMFRMAQLHFRTTRPLSRSATNIADARTLRLMAMAEGLRPLPSLRPGPLPWPRRVGRFLRGRS